MLVFFIWACLGTSLFGRIRFGQRLTSNLNFRTFSDSLVVLVHVLLGDWVRFKEDCVVSAPDCTDYLSDDENDCGPHYAIVIVYFYSFILIANYVFLNLFVVRTNSAWCIQMFTNITFWFVGGCP